MTTFYALIALAVSLMLYGVLRDFHTPSAYRRPPKDALKATDRDWDELLND